MLVTASINGHLKVYAMESDLIRRADLSVEQYQALLQVSESIAKHLDLTALVHDLAHLLPRVAHVNFVALSLYDSARHVMQLHNVQANIPADIVGGREEPVDETPAGLVWQTQQPLLFQILPRNSLAKRYGTDAGGRHSFLLHRSPDHGATTTGCHGFASVQEGAYEDTDVEFLQQVGKQVAVAVDNVLHHQDLTHDRDRLRLLLEVSESIASHRDLEGLFRDLAQRLPHVVPFDYINAVLHEPERDVMRLWLLVTSQPSTISPGLGDYPWMNLPGDWCGKPNSL